MKKHNRPKWMAFSLFLTVIFVVPLFLGTQVPCYAGSGGGDQDWYTEDVGAVYSKDWTKEQIREFIDKPWTEHEKENLLGPAELGYIIDKKGFPFPRVKPKKGEKLTPTQLYMNGKSYWLPILLQYGVGINAKTFRKIWLEEGKWKDPKHVLLDIRMESEFLQGHIPGAIRLDTGLDFWHLPGLAPDPEATYYLQCKSGTPADGGDRGGIVARHMRIMGYTGDIYNITDGFRGWIEQGFPVINRHGQFKLVPGTFQKSDPFLKKHPKTLPYSPQP